MSSENMKTHIKEIVSKVFPNLNSHDIWFVQEYTVRLIEYMSVKYGFNNYKERFEILFKQNNNQHIYSSIKLLLPYMDDANEFALFASIKNLSDITVKKHPNTDLKKNPDKNPYMLSTYQYSRYYDTNKEDINDEVHGLYDHQYRDHIQDKIYEYLYSAYDIQENYYLLCETIELTRTKMMANWLDIIPITKNNYKTSQLYENSPSYIDGKMMIQDFRMSEWNLDNDMFYYHGISCYDMFNAVHVYMFKEIYNSGVKWLMYEKQVAKNTVPITYLQLLDKIVSIEYLNQGYGTLSTTIQKNINDQWKNLKVQANTTQKNFLKCVIFKFDWNYCHSEIETEFNYDSSSFYEPYKKVNFDDEDSFLSPDDIDINSIRL